jgi:hypothetical protein
LTLVYAGAVHRQPGKPLPTAPTAFAFCFQQRRAGLAVQFEAAAHASRTGFVRFVRLRRQGRKLILISRSA